MGAVDLDPDHGDSDGARWYMTEQESVPYSTEAGEVPIDVAPAVAGTRLHLPDEELSLPSKASAVRIDVTVPG